MIQSTWRLLVDSAEEAFMNMAVDEAVLMHCIAGKSAPTLRFYEWEKPSISIGYAMDAEAEVNLPLCRERDVPVVRRMTGGGLVFHKCDITYTVIFPDDSACEQAAKSGRRLSVLESYRLVNLALAEGLREAGVTTSLLGREEGKGGGSRPGGNVCFSNPTVYDILHNGRKLAGSAQRRKKEWVLHQGSMLFSSDFVKTCPLVATRGADDPRSPDAVSHASESSSDNPMARTAVSLEEILGEKPDRERIVAVLSENFARALGVKLERSQLTRSEMEMAERLRNQKYSTDDWNLRRSVGATTRLFA
ncbi:lipoate--protein ligase family protein [bacterium]|nr:lipoate--protein ligase family protein [bacterium]